MSDVGDHVEEIAQALFAGNRWMALARGTPDDEETDAAYARQPVAFSLEREGDTLVAKNGSRVQFAPYANDAAEPVRRWAVYEKNRGGRPLFSVDLERPKRPLEGDAPHFKPGQAAVIWVVT